MTLYDFAETIDAIGREGLGAFRVAGAVNPNQTVLGFHLAGDIEEPIFVFAKFLGDECDGADR